AAYTRRREGRQAPASGNRGLRRGGIRTLRGPTGEVTSLALGGDGQRLICGSDDRTIKGWDLNDRPQGPLRLGRVVAETGVPANNRSVRAADPSPSKRVGRSHLPPPRALG